jgi:hypothetical protein
MPLSLRTTCTFPIVLDVDADQPEAQRSTFHGRYLAAGEVIDLQDAIFKAKIAATYPEARDILEAALAGKIVGWSNIISREGKPIAFGEQKLSGICSEEELFELADKSLAGLGAERGGPKKIQVAIQLRYGKLCSDCKAAGKCVHDTAGTSEVGWICGCGGTNPDCPTCRGGGHVALDVCPHQFVSTDVRQLLRAADLAEKGSWPLSGGWLEQQAGVIQGVQEIWDQDQAMRRALGID